MTTPDPRTDESTETTAGRRRSLVEYDWSAGADQVAANLHAVAAQIAAAARAEDRNRPR